MNTSSLMAGVATGIVTFIACVPVVSWLMRDKRQRTIALVLAGLVAIALGVVVGRVLQHELGASPGEISPALEDAS